MAATVNVPGPCLIRVSANGTLTTLGYTADGVRIEEMGYFSDVPGDQNGGSEGPPIDIQYFGDVHRVSFDLTKYDEDLVNLIRRRVNTATAGTAGTVVRSGVLLAAGDFMFGLHLIPYSPTRTNAADINTAHARRYLAAIPREPVSCNIGSKFRRTQFSFTCYTLNGVLWDANVTGPS